MKRSRIHKQLGEMLLGLLIALTIPAACLAQATFKAQLRGTVQDASKAAVPRATVTLTNEVSQVSEKTTTDEQGRYSFNNVRPAEYTVKVEAAGFKAAVGVLSQSGLKRNNFRQTSWGNCGREIGARSACLYCVPNPASQWEEHEETEEVVVRELLSEFDH